MKRFLAIAAVLSTLFAIAAGYVCVQYYPYVFAQTVTGELIGVDKVAPGSAFVGSQGTTIAFSVAVAIRSRETGDIFTASSDDRQWAVAEKGQCAEVKLFPYPPWDLKKSGTWHNARLLKLLDCPPAKVPLQGTVPGVVVPPTPMPAPVPPPLPLPTPVAAVADGGSVEPTAPTPPAPQPTVPPEPPPAVPTPTVPAPTVPAPAPFDAGPLPGDATPSGLPPHN